MKTTISLVLLTCVALLVSGCSSSPQSLIVGKWQAAAPGGKITAEFTKDGKATLTMFGQPLQGTYKVNGSDELEWTLNGKTTKHKMKVTATELELTSDGNTIVYKRV